MFYPDGMSADTPARKPDKRVVACNYVVGTSIASEGALAYVCSPNPGGGYDRMCIVVRSRGGRWVEKWEDTRRLGNFRAKTVPPESPVYRLGVWDIDADALAEVLARPA